MGERQQQIAHGMQVEALQVTALAEMAVKTNDAQLKDLLAKSGFNLDRKPEAAAPSK